MQPKPIWAWRLHTPAWERAGWLEAVINSRKAIKCGFASWHFLINCALNFLHFPIKARAPSSTLLSPLQPKTPGEKGPSEAPHPQTLRPPLNRKAALTSVSKTQTREEPLGRLSQDRIQNREHAGAPKQEGEAVSRSIALTKGRK